MKYFLDTEFHEYKRKPYLSRPVDTIELISIGIVAEDGREYYAISKDFDVKQAFENEWLRDNVLKGIFYKDLVVKEFDENINFDHNEFEYLVIKYGKTKKQIAEEVKDFCLINTAMSSLDRGTANLIWFTGEYPNEETQEKIKELKCIYIFNGPVQFYGYYSDYDWVVFCWLFGRMIDLPKGFPMYCIDLKQIFDEKASKFTRNDFFTAADFLGDALQELSLKEKIAHLKMHVAYPKQTNEHNAFADAKWNFELYKFLQTI